MNLPNAVFFDVTLMQSNRKNHKPHAELPTLCPQCHQNVLGDTLETRLTALLLGFEEHFCMNTFLRILLAAAVAATTLASPSVYAASCTAKCADEEDACVKRTNNKGQCGSKAKQCTDKCK
jgi:hypothetical protein